MARSSPQPRRGPKPGTPSWRRFNYTDELIADWRRRYEETPEPATAIARDYGVEETTVRRMAKRFRWTRFKAPPVDLPPALRLRRRAEALAQIPLIPAQAGIQGQDRDAGGLDPGSPLSAFALRASADFKRAEARKASVGGSRGRTDKSTPPGDDGLLPHPELIAGLQRELQGLLAEVTAARERAWLSPADTQRLTHTLSHLTATLNTLVQLNGKTQQAQPAGTDYDDMPADIDEFRDELARRIRAFFAARRGGGDAGGDAAPSVAQGGA